MKKTLLTLFIVASSFLVTNQSTRQANVPLMEGIPVYILSEPVDQYTVIKKFGTGLTVIKSATLKNITNAYVKAAVKQRNKGVDFDAIYLDGSGKGKLIKFE